MAIDRFSAEEPEPGGSQWTTVNQDYNQSPVYLQSGMQVDANDLVPGRYRLRLFGDGSALADATISFTSGRPCPTRGSGRTTSATSTSSPSWRPSPTPAS